MATGGALEAIVLAAGAGRRFGGGKLLAPWRGGVLLDGALSAAFAAPARAVWLVTGADERVEGAASAFAEGRGEAGRLRLVHAADHALGLSASLKTGLSALPADAAGAFVFLGDMPSVPVAILAPMAQALESGAAAAVPAFDGQWGNPALLGRALFDAAARLEGDKGARGLLQALGERLAVIDAPDAGVLHDVDRPEDLSQGPAPR